MKLYKRRSLGMYSLTWEDLVAGRQSSPTWRVQFYWPEVNIRDKRGWNLHLSINFCVRIAWGTYSDGWRGTYRGFGFKFFGLGIGVDRQEYVRDEQETK